MVSEGDLVSWNSRFGNRAIGKVADVKDDGELCSEKSPDYCLSGENGTMLEIEHWGKDNGVRGPEDKSATVHYERNVQDLECEDGDEDGVLKCKDSERDYTVEDT